MESEKQYQAMATFDPNNMIEPQVVILKPDSRSDPFVISESLNSLIGPITEFRGPTSNQKKNRNVPPRPKAKRKPKGKKTHRKS